MNIKREAKKRKLPAYINEEEFINLLKVVKNPKYKLSFGIAFNCGLRISEVLKLKPEEVDLKGKKIFIKNSKWGKDRVVPLPKAFKENHLKFMPLLKHYSNLKSGVRSNEKAFKRYIQKANIIKDGLHYHSLRHSFAIRCMEKGIPLNHIQMLLGHEDISTTSIYLKINPIDALKSYQELW